MSILVMAPYAELYKKTRAYIGQQHLDILVEQGDLEHGLSKALEICKRIDVDIVISRGGTASLLRKKLDKVVLEISVTGYDLLRAIYPHFLKGHRIAVVGYQNIIHGAQSIASILNADFGIFTITQTSILEEVIADARSWGAEIIIGDAVSTTIAKQMGLSIELITSGSEAIEYALQNGIQVHDQIVEKNAALKRMNSIIESAQNGIVYIDSNGMIQQLNDGALQCLHRVSDQLLHHKVSATRLPEPIKACLEGKNVEAASEKGIVERLGSTSLYIKTVRIDIGEKKTETIAFIHDTGKIRRLEAQIREGLSDKGLKTRYSFETMTFGDPETKMTIEKAKKYSFTDSTVLLLGETGTGKEVFAQSIHNHSSRRNGPFVAVNCAALPDTLLESELFGYTEGAFTGANKGGKIGLFEMAHLGTIFLDEVNEMNIQLQARFLRVLQEREIMRIGDNKVIRVDVRVIAATNKDLYREVCESRFRSDLYYRLKVLDIEIQPLRKRPYDIAPLFQSFVQFYANKYGYSTPTYSAKFESAMTRYPWPGNVRELRNFAEKFIVLSSVESTPESLIQELLDSAVAKAQERANDQKKRFTPLREKEREIIYSVLAESNDNISQAARALGISRNTLKRKLGDTRMNQGD